jgi:polysaccharide export outer membrane protein
LPRDTALHNIVNRNLELQIRKNDLLSINIVAPALDIALFNLQQGNPSSSGSAGASVTGTSGTSNQGYLVDNNGNITMYKLGSVHVEGLTRNQLKLLLEKELFPYLNQSVVTVRFLNNRVTMLGELGRPQVLSMPNEQISILEAIGQSGDLTITGRRDNILVIRQTEDGREFKRLNLNDNSIFNSPFYYLKPDDVVYVEPTKFKIKNSGETAQIIGFALTGLSILITLFAYIVR